MRRGLARSVIYMILAVSSFACSPSTASNNDHPALTSIGVTPAASSLAIGGNQQFTAIGTYSNGTTRNITLSVDWASSDTAVATIDSAGIVHGRAAGVTTVTATISGTFGSGTLTVTSNPVNWTWMGGSNLRDQSGFYGTKGAVSPSNVPGARDSSISWTDMNGDLWLFGGWGHGSDGNDGELNDLWKFDGTNWSWVNGSDIANQPGVYGIKGVAAPSNVPGARHGAVSWTDTNGNFWLFGGYGYVYAGYLGYLSDLWKFDGTNWTWVSGSTAGNQPGIYGIKGTVSASNAPGARMYATPWVDKSGNLWLFGGWGYDSAGSNGGLNDLWKFDGTNWTWVSGSGTADQPGVYGIKGAASASNAPGGRGDCSGAWVDSSNNLWMFGGNGSDSAGNNGLLNDLWKFDGTNWTWVSGSDFGNQPGDYGTVGTPSVANVPGGRGWHSGSWIDSSGNFWLFGGVGYDSAGGTRGLLNDLWKFDGTYWTWMKGAYTIEQPGVYGIKGTATELNGPGARYASISWTDASGNFWLFGGTGHNCDEFNDLWYLELP